MPSRAVSRRYRKISDDLRSEAQARGVDIGAPRGPRGRAAKATPSSSANGKGKGEANKGMTACRARARVTDTGKTGQNVASAISLDDSTSEHETKIKPKDADRNDDSNGNGIGNGNGKLVVKSEFTKSESSPFARYTPSDHRTQPIIRNGISSVAPVKHFVEDDLPNEPMSPSPTSRVKTPRIKTD